MASVGNDSNGRKRVLFVAGDGSRRTVRLGKCSQRDADEICRHVEALAASKINGQSIERKTSVWLTEAGEVLRDRLARAGLIEPIVKGEQLKLGAFLDACITQRPDVKAGTKAIFKKCRNAMVEHFGENRRLDQVSTADADAFRAALQVRGSGRSTVAQHCRYARHFLSIAKRRGLIQDNPFAHIKGATSGDPSRRQFVPAGDVAKVVEVAPSTEWKLMISLARWGGLRVPTELLALTWRDVDLVGKRFVVRAPKTEHHKEGGVRVVPMFPELATLFQTAYDEAAEGAVHVITRYRDDAVNLRTRFKAYIEAAGLKPWPKLWQNLRVSRATELADLYPSHVCAAWLGHSEKVADAFYRQVTDVHFDRAVGDMVGGAAQNPAQQPSEMAGNGRNEKKENTLEPVKTSVSDAPRGEVAEAGMGRVGPELSAGSLTNRPVLGKRGTESGTLPVRMAQVPASAEVTEGATGNAPSAPELPPELRQIVAVWPRLPKPVRQAIVALTGLGESQDGPGAGGQGGGER